MDVEIVDENQKFRVPALLFGAMAVAIAAGGPLLVYNMCRIDVPREYMAIMIKKTGKELENDSVSVRQAS